jgi:hypothetical protein
MENQERPLDYNLANQEVPNSVSTRSVGIRFGLILSIFSIVYFLILNVSGVNMATGYWNWIGYVVGIVIIFLAHKYYKENTDGFMNYSQGIGIAFWLGLISSAISSVFTYIYIKFIDSSMLEMISDAQIEAMEKKGLSDEEIEQAMKFASMFSTPEALLGFGLIGGIISTIIIALIVTIFTQKRKPEVF